MAAPRDSSCSQCQARSSAEKGQTYHLQVVSYGLEGVVTGVVGLRSHSERTASVMIAVVAVVEVLDKAVH